MSLTQPLTKLKTAPTMMHCEPHSVEESTKARASDAEHCKDDLIENVGMESQSDKPEGEEDPDLATVPTFPSMSQPTGVPEFNTHKITLKHKRMTSGFLMGHEDTLGS